MRLKRHFAAIVLGLCVMASANAILPLGAAVVWLGGVVSANASLVSALEASIYVHAGAFVIYDMFFANKDSNGAATGTPPLTVKINPGAARSNPDSSKFDDPAPGARDVTPKTTAKGTQASINTPAGQAPIQLYCYQNSCAVGPQQACESYPIVGSATVHQKMVYNGSDGQCHLFRATDPDPTYVDFGGSNLTRTTGCPGIGVSASGGKCPGSNFPETGPVTCPAGYKNGTGTDCTLSDASAVKKPETQPCEILRTSSGFQSDAANPNCAQQGIQIQGNSIQMNSQSISINADGSVSVATPTGQTTFQIGSYGSDGSATITGVSRSGNPGAFTPTSSGTGSGTGGGSSGSGGGVSGTSPSCGGVGQAACSSGNGNGGSSCGAPGQPACSIDDSGFNGKSVSIAAGEAALDSYGTQKTSLLDTVKNGVTTPDFGWKLPVQSMSCHPLEFGFFKGMRFQFNWCQYIGLIHQAISFLAYCFTALYLFGLLYSNRQGAK